MSTISIPPLLPTFNPPAFEFTDFFHSNSPQNAKLLVKMGGEVLLVQIDS
jgi:hypothetical protein